MRQFTEAVNSSRLRCLNLSCNPTGGRFVPWLLEHLDTRFLNSLELSMTGLQPDSGTHIATYLRSSRCRLRRLSINGNELGYDSLQLIVSAYKHNFTISTLDMHANLTDADSTMTEVLKSLTAQREKLQDRNQMLRQLVREESLCLLRHARLVLCRREKNLDVSASHASLHARSLPTEILLHILSFLAPTLSAAQRIRIYAYASDSTTLPPLLPNLMTRIAHHADNHRAARPHTPTTKRGEEQDEWLITVDCSACDRAPDIDPVPSHP